MPRKPAKKKKAKPKPKKKLHHKIHEKAKDWDASMKKYKFYKMVAKDMMMGIAFLGTVGGSVFKGTMRALGWDHPTLPTWLGGKDEAAPEVMAEAPAPVPRASSRRVETEDRPAEDDVTNLVGRGGGGSGEGTIGLGDPNSIGHGAGGHVSNEEAEAFEAEMGAEMAREEEAIEHLGDSGMTLASAPIPEKKNEYLLAQTKAPTYAQKPPETHELIVYYIPHIFWLMCISFVTWRVSKGVYAWWRRKKG